MVEHGVFVAFFEKLKRDIEVLHHWHAVKPYAQFIVGRRVNTVKSHLSCGVKNFFGVEVTSFAGAYTDKGHVLTAPFHEQLEHIVNVHWLRLAELAAVIVPAHGKLEIIVHDANLPVLRYAASHKILTRVGQVVNVVRQYDRGVVLVQVLFPLLYDQKCTLSD